MKRDDPVRMENSNNDGFMFGPATALCHLSGVMDCLTTLPESYEWKDWGSVFLSCNRRRAFALHRGLQTRISHPAFLDRPVC